MACVLPPRHCWLNLAATHHVTTTPCRQRSCLLLTWLVAIALTSQTTASEPRINFDTQIRPILSQTCFACHGPDAKQRQADLRLDLAAGLASVTNKSESKKNSLIQRITSSDPDLRMPPEDSNRELSAKQIQLLKQWVREGATYDRHWAYVPPQAGKLPKVGDQSWATNAIDRYVLSQIERAGLKPAPPADRITLIRRLSWDLTGLPPAPSAVDSFLRDQREDAWEQLVDRLLDSPHYGERMAMYWLDLVRFADTVGYHGDQVHPISPYRDYVIAAFNDNMPFDRFTMEQLAGDLVPGSTIEQKIASGYNRLLQTTHEGGAQDKEYLAKYAADRVRNVSSVWLGATLGCCECHDHKYDPFTTRDFYSMAAFFADVQERGNFRSAKRDPEIQVQTALDKVRLQQLKHQIQELRKRLSAQPTDIPTPEMQKWSVRIAALEQEYQVLQKSKRATMITVATQPRTVRILHRGDWQDTTGEIVLPAIPQFLGQVPATSGRATRRDLANWITSPDNPLTARVLSNRLWYLFWGRGLFDSLEDTGAQGSVPTHPELLDHLALELTSSGWNIKHLVKQIVMSSAYRQSSNATTELLTQAPENRYFARQARFRLPAEMIRDGALAVSELLNTRVGGPSTHPYQPAGYYAHLNFPKRKYQHDTGANQYRRGLYTHWQRQFLHPMLRAFDAPSRETCTAQRAASNTPAAALTLMNDPSFIEAARSLAALTLHSGGSETSARINWVWRRVLSRPPSPTEQQALQELLKAERTYYSQHPQAAQALIKVGDSTTDSTSSPQELAAWMAITRTLLNLHETITRD